jgi:hypothetical protein
VHANALHQPLCCSAEQLYSRMLPAVTSLLLLLPVLLPALLLPLLLLLVKLPSLTAAILAG